jgi:hypothetical protein
MMILVAQEKLRAKMCLIHPRQEHSGTGKHEKWKGTTLFPLNPQLLTQM